LLDVAVSDPLPSIADFLTALSRVTWWRFALECLVIGAVVYWVIRFLQGTRGVRVLKGIVVVLITLYLGVRILGGVFELDRLNVLFQQFTFYASFAILIVFQPELRRALMRLGETRLFRGPAAAVDEVEQLTTACATLSRRKVGALVAFERDTGLGGYAEEATPVDAVVTTALLTTIFHPNTSLHDLGVVIRNGRIAFAGVQFPLAESGDVAKELGSRHRAAVGLSQETDAVVVIVSEETGDVSIAERGQLHRKLGVDRLREMLHDLLGQSVPLPDKSDLRGAREAREQREARERREAAKREAARTRSRRRLPKPGEEPPLPVDPPTLIREIKPMGESKRPMGETKRDRGDGLDPAQPAA
jgi:diadenylate cyclase